MLFSSISFLYYFLPCVLILYLVTPRKLKNFVLLLSSLFFYGWGGVNFLWLMMIMLAAGYIWGLLVGKYREQKIGKWLLGAALGMNVLTLIYFKFADVFPIGISFYTFQIMSYIVDIYRGEVPAQKNPVNFSAYASMFPQLVAGPIVRYADIAKQLESRAHSFDHVALGIRTFVLGLAKKVLIANTLGELCDIFRASNDKAVLFYWLYAAAFTLHIYFDFSGYSDMAVGLGKMFGFDFMDNFNYPYISKSITEFWRRWHISLSSWFRDYVYIPLGGNRVPKGRWFFNIFVVWFLTGFWHGAAWNFIAWGLGFAIILVIEKMWLLRQLEQSKGVAAQILRHVYVMVIVMISFVLFNATDITEAGTYIASMFGLGDLALVSKETVYYMRSYLVIFLVAMIGATPIPKMLVCKMQETKVGKTLLDVAEPIALVILLMVVTAYLVDGSFNPFLYFRF
ncbi:MAG: MBOAT family protein [Lachnospiraceae bacterium]|nr:MBOAT family protein [Lachnospiraceae bacterium]